MARSRHRPDRGPPRLVRRLAEPSIAPATAPPRFGPAFCRQFGDLLLWRRDVRRFQRTPIDEALIDELLDLACLAPSVGNSQPWRFVRVDDPARRQAVSESFRACNQAALADYNGSRARLYASLKLAGLAEAPIHLAVFVDEETAQGHGLGRKTMAETLHYSAVAAIHTFWLAARAHGIGVGWVSILDPPEIRGILDLPASWSLVAYLCVGYPEEEHADPELARHGWQARNALCRQVTRR